MQNFKGLQRRPPVPRPIGAFHSFPVLSLKDTLRYPWKKHVSGKSGRPFISSFCYYSVIVQEDTVTSTNQLAKLHQLHVHKNNIKLLNNEENLRRRSNDLSAMKL